MERADWLKHVQRQTEDMYDHFAPEFWVKYGFYENEAHLAYIQKFLERIPPGGVVLSAACGAGRYDGLLLEAGHPVFGIDQSAGMLVKAREKFPQARYEKIALQEMIFHEDFDGAICIDAMEHICPEDYPLILRKLQEALKPGAALYFTAEPPDTEEAQEVQDAYERSKAKGLPVVFGEIADEIDEACAQIRATGSQPLSVELMNQSVYRYFPPLEQVRAWIEQAGLAIEEDGTGSELHHFIVQKK